MPKNRYTPEEILQHLRTVELDGGKGLAVLDPCRQLGITEQDARSASQRGTVLHAERSPDHHRTLEDSLQHGPSAQQSRGPATRSRNHPACELRTNMGGGTKTPGWSITPGNISKHLSSYHDRRWPRALDRRRYRAYPYRGFTARKSFANSLTCGSMMEEITSCILVWPTTPIQSRAQVVAAIVCFGLWTKVICWSSSTRAFTA